MVLIEVREETRGGTMRRNLNKVLVSVLTGILTFTALGINAEALTINPDINADRIVDQKDLTEISKYYNTSNSKYDLNKDGIVDIYDNVMVSKYIGLLYNAYDSAGNIVKGFGYNQLGDAIKLAAGSSGRTASNLNGQTIWDNSSYWVFDGETYLNKFSNSYDAVNAVGSSTNGRAYNKFGTELINNTTGYKEKLAVTQDDLYIRTQPSNTYKTANLVPNNTTIEIVRRTYGFYEFKWYKNATTVVTGYVPSYLDFIQDDRNGSMFGNIAANYESNGDPGAISSGTGDLGGVSYGAFQFSSNVGSLTAFVTWLYSAKQEFYTILNNGYIADGKTYGANFQAAWKQLASSNYDEFYALQLSYTKENYYDRFVSISKSKGYDPGRLLQYNSTRNMIFSTAIQHGPTGAYNIMSGIDQSLSMTDFITAVYDARLKTISYSYPAGSTTYNSVKNRYYYESGDIIRNYQREISY